MLRYTADKPCPAATLDETLFLDGLECRLEIDGTAILDGVVSDAEGELYEALYISARNLLDERRQENACKL